MSDDSNIISLSDRARQRKGPRPAGNSGPAQAGAQQGTATSTSAAQPAATKPVPAHLVWLYCPTCQTLEYTEMQLPNGRVHQPCGTRVEEVVVPVDARAEYSLAELNMRQLDKLAELVEGQRARFREYQQRLELAAHQPLSSYPLTEDTVRIMPVAEVDPLGLLISPFLRHPLERFRPEPAAGPAADTDHPTESVPPAGGAPGSDKPTP
jgi:hypothetical protein